MAKRRLRLVHAGRILTDGTRLVPWLDALESRARNASTTANAASNASPTSPTTHSYPPRTSLSLSRDPEPDPDPDPDVWIHCSIGPEGEDIDGEEKQQQTQITPLTGFDRLASAGFSAEDIESMRRQFHAQRPEAADQGELYTVIRINGVGVIMVYVDDEHARALEEQWVDNMDAGLPGTDTGDGGESSSFK